MNHLLIHVRRRSGGSAKSHTNRRQIAWTFVEQAREKLDDRWWSMKVTGNFFPGPKPFAKSCRLLALAREVFKKHGFVAIFARHQDLRDIIDYKYKYHVIFNNFTFQLRPIIVNPNRQLRSYRLLQYLGWAQPDGNPHENLHNRSENYLTRDIGHAPSFGAYFLTPSIAAALFELEAHKLVMNPPVLSYWNAAPPVAVLIASRIGGVPLKHIPVTEQRSPATATLTFDDGTKLFGVHSILRFIARRSSKSANLYGADAFASVLVRPVLFADPCSERCAAFTARSSQLLYPKLFPVSAAILTL